MPLYPTSLGGGERVAPPPLPCSSAGPYIGPAPFRRPIAAQLLAAALLLWGSGVAAGQESSPASDPSLELPRAKPRVEVVPSSLEAEVGQEQTFAVAVTDTLSEKAVVKPAQAWFAAPTDVAVADPSGRVTFYNPGRVRIIALTEEGVAIAMVNVKPSPVARIQIEPPAGPLVVGGALPLRAVAFGANDNPRENVELTWKSDDPAIASVDATGLVTGVALGRTTVRAQAERGQGALEVEVVANPVRTLTVEPATTKARTGDVVRFRAGGRGEGGAEIASPSVRWAVSGEGAVVEPDGGFVAARPGTYVVSATSGDRVALATVVVAPRKVERDIEVVGRAPVQAFETAEQWIIGDHAYLASIADRVWIYDISDPAHPVKTDSLVVDARIVNDISTTADGKIGVLTREGASDRKNGIVFFDASDPAHPKIVSHYTETVTGGVHSAFIDGHYVYLTDDATGSLRVIDFQDVKRPREVARWQVENPIARRQDVPGADAFSSGRYLHDVYVKDGLIYLAYWRDGLVILDVGNGIKGGTPEKPQLVSQLRFNHNELYGPDWLAGTHTVFRYKNYLFVGDEVFPPDWGLNPAYEKGRVPTRGILHVVDVADIEHPRKVAEYAVPEAGAHNVWVEDDVLAMGYYGGGGRVLDVSGELRGDLYAQGREIGRLWAGDANGYVPNLPNTWGAQHHDGLIFFNDINSGLWITRLGEPRDSGSTTAPGY